MVELAAEQSTADDRYPFSQEGVRVPSIKPFVRIKYNNTGALLYSPRRNSGLQVALPSRSHFSLEEVGTGNRAQLAGSMSASISLPAAGTPNNISFVACKSF